MGAKQTKDVKDLSSFLKKAVGPQTSYEMRALIALMRRIEPSDLLIAIKDAMSATIDEFQLQFKQSPLCTLNNLANISQKEMNEIYNDNNQKKIFFMKTLTQLVTMMRPL